MDYRGFCCACACVSVITLLCVLCIPVTTLLCAGYHSVCKTCKFTCVMRQLYCTCWLVLCSIDDWQLRSGTFAQLHTSLVCMCVQLTVYGWTYFISWMFLVEPHPLFRTFHKDYPANEVSPPVYCHLHTHTIQAQMQLCKGPTQNLLFITAAQHQTGCAVQLPRETIKLTCLTHRVIPSTHSRVVTEMQSTHSRVVRDTQAHAPQKPQ